MAAQFLSAEHDTGECEAHTQRRVPDGSGERCGTGQASRGGAVSIMGDRVRGMDAREYGVRLELNS